ncbi:MAG: signal peptidase II [Candidatus Omnitrophica bacterium CG1_02_44_16]|nr:MAG: signal peptidase II [Candidatus Omnitrophica bacterium CG1_02_44_16]PIZ84425.1 MAG: signal peptidase II [Candidatus Omnitrophica bacterium CG_4_10_14_0_2_um_filter_44_9]
MLSFLFISVFILILDQWTKYAAECFLALGRSLPVINGVFHLTLAHNKGAAFSILKGGSFFFIAATFLCLAAITYLLNNKSIFKKVFDLDNSDRLVRFSLALVFGGACGNVIDRIRFSYVVDFLDFRVWPVFNIADSAITVGGILIAYKMFRKKGL